MEEYCKPDIIKEKKYTYHVNSELTQGLPYCVSEVGECILGDKYYLERKDMDFYTVLYTISGKGLLNYLNENIEATDGSTFILNSRIFQVHKTCPKDEWHFKFFHFSTFNNNSILPLFIGREIKMDETRQVFEEIESLTQYSSIRADISISSLLDAYFSNIALSTLTLTKEDSVISQVLDYIKMNCRSNLNIEQIASHFNLSKYYFIHLFKKQTSMSPYQYLINCRIDLSKDLLAQGIKIEDITWRCNFGNPNNFNRIFKRKTGTTPNEFRKNVSANARC